MLQDPRASHRPAADEEDADSDQYGTEADGERHEHEKREQQPVRIPHAEKDDCQAGRARHQPTGETDGEEVAESRDAALEQALGSVRLRNGRGAQGRLVGVLVPVGVFVRMPVRMTVGVLVGVTMSMPMGMPAPVVMGMAVHAGPSLEPAAPPEEEDEPENHEQQTRDELRHHDHDRLEHALRGRRARLEDKENGPAK
jgi:hypothetical protein